MVLLLVTPVGVFGQVVPFLVLIGSLALLLQPRIAAWQARREAPGRGGLLLLPVGLFALSVYNGYFGAGSGVLLLLALLLLTAEPVLVSANALKNMLVGAATISSAVLFALFAHVDWTAVAPLAAGTFLGSLAGPRVAAGCRPACSAGWSRSPAWRWPSGSGSTPPAEQARLVRPVQSRVRPGCVRSRTIRSGKPSGRAADRQADLLIGYGSGETNCST